MPAASSDSVEPTRLTADEQPDHAEEHVHSPERQPCQPAPVLDQHTLTEAGELLRALTAPVRIAIVLQLRVAERCVHELVETLNVTQPLISQHLRVLKSAGVVDNERHGREVVYHLVDEHLAHIVVDAVTHAEELTGTSRERDSHGTADGDDRRASPNRDDHQDVHHARTMAEHSRQETETA